jgi:hypothetical protein
MRDDIRKTRGFEVVWSDNQHPNRAIPGTQGKPAVRLHKAVEKGTYAAVDFMTIFQSYQ